MKHERYELLNELEALCDATREDYLGEDEIYYGVRYINVHLLKGLIDQNTGVISKKDTVGDCEDVSVANLIAFMEEYPSTEAFGYIFHEHRSITIKHLHLCGLIYRGFVSSDVLDYFDVAFASADEVIAGDDSLECHFNFQYKRQ